MSTTVKVSATRTTMAGVDNVNYGLATTPVAAVLYGHFFPTTGATKLPLDIRTSLTSVATGSGLSFAFISDRLSGPVTIASAVTLSHYGRDFTKWGSLNATFRFELSKIRTTGNIETVIGSLDEPEIASGETQATQYATSIPVPTPVEVVAGERLILRVFLIPAPGQTMVGTATSVSSDLIPGLRTTANLITLTFTETFTFTGNVTRLYQRRTSTIGISDYLDLLTTKVTQTGLTATVSVAGGEFEVPWTRTPVASLTFANMNISIADTSNLASYVTAAFTPVANRLYLLGVVHSDTAPEVTEPTVSSTTGLTFVKIGSVPFDTIASNVHRLTVFRAMKPSGLSNGTITVSLADAGTGLVAQVIEVQGVVTTGTDGSDAAVNVSTNSANTTANPSITMGAYASGYNGVLAFFGTDATGPTAVLGSGWSAFGTDSYATPTTTLTTLYKPGNEATVTSSSAAQDWAGLAVELVAAQNTVTPLHWLSPRLSGPWYFDAPDAAALAVAMSIAIAETNATMDAAYMIRLFRWRDGTETQFYQFQYNLEINVGTIGSSNTPSFSNGTQTVTPLGFQADDRIVMRVYVIPASGQTLKGGNAVLTYDAGAVSFGTGWIDLFDLPTSGFKAESDPATPATVPDAMSTMGMQN